MTKQTKALVKFDFDVAVITALDARYADIQTAEGTKNLALVMEGLSEYREIRTQIDTLHKEYKKDILIAGRSLDGDKNRLKSLIQPGESRLRDLKNVEDDRKDAIREEKATKERERVEAIQKKIVSIRDLGVMRNEHSSFIQDRLVLTRGIEISEDIYQEFIAHAIAVRRDTIIELEEALKDRLQFEKEEEDRKAESERLEAQRKEQEAAQAKIDEGNRKVREGIAKLEMDREAAEAAKEREDFERKAQEEADIEAKKKLEREACDRLEKEEAEKEEKARQEFLRPDREKLTKWVQSFNETNNPTPQLKSKKAKEILGIAKDQVEIILQDLEDKANKL